MGWNNYKRTESTSLEPGDYRVVIIDTEEKLSQAGNKMLVITLKPSGSNIKLKYYLVDGEWFDRNLTSIYDSFDIPEGNMEFVSWIGAMGAAKLVRDDNDYLKVKYFIKKNNAESLPPFEGDKPERQQVTKFEEVGSEDDLPF